MKKTSIVMIVSILAVVFLSYDNYKKAETIKNLEQEKQVLVQSKANDLIWEHDEGGRALVSLVQIIHDANQVKSVSELVVGKKYLEICANGDKRVIEICDVHSNMGIFYVTYPGKEDKSPIAWSLADSGLAPYDNGVWNARNYLVAVKE